MEQIADLIGRENMDSAMVVIILIAIAFLYIFFYETYRMENKPMSSDNSKVVVSRTGIGFCGVFFIILFLLKIGVIETAVTGWSWWLITLPLWGPTCLFLGILLIIGIVVAFGLLIAAAIDKISK